MIGHWPLSVRSCQDQFARLQVRLMSGALLCRFDCAANLREQVEAQAQANKEKDSGSKKKGKKGKKEKSKGAYKLFALYSSG